MKKKLAILLTYIYLIFALATFIVETKDFKKQLKDFFNDLNENNYNAEFYLFIMGTILTMIGFPQFLYRLIIGIMIKNVPKALLLTTCP